MPPEKGCAHELPQSLFILGAMLPWTTTFAEVDPLCPACSPADISVPIGISVLVPSTAANHRQLRASARGAPSPSISTAVEEAAV
jgi:hypothetical protein